MGLAVRWWAGERRGGEEVEVAGDWRQYALKVTEGWPKGRGENLA